jgi:hypothetical protein
MKPASRPALAALLILASMAVLTLRLTAQEAAATPQVTLESIRVDPPAPAADTLCKLTVGIRNAGDRTVSQFGFSVRINDAELPVYVNQLFMYPIEPGASLEIPLYNFWSTETSRPVPANGKLELVVTLREAEWMRIEMEDDVEVWTPLGTVEHLPSTRSVTLEMPKGAGS